MSVGVNVSPRAVFATTYQQLERKMSLIAVKRGTYVKFHSISFVNGKWFAWYDTQNKINFKKDFKDDTSKE